MQVNYAPYSTIKPADLRPTAMEQLRLTSFCIDAPRRELTISSAPLVAAAADALPLSDPRDWGDGVEHVSARVADDELLIDGLA